MMYVKVVSLDSRLSDRKNPSSSDESWDKLQNCLSLNSDGAGAAAWPVFIRHRSRHMAMNISRRRVTVKCGNFMAADLNVLRAEIHDIGRQIGLLFPSHEGMEIPRPF